ncbi:hypothetical protein [Trueperella pecoris]|uniref:DNA primase n=1 Tax=Trueperella pecoris TaxID=2733571 RepID=A0A7M1QRE5_9ACTO|nr:hypothetical protein [Trueperella pecoris]QOR44722.1 hypothetical protein INS88_05255 [Trueperella pecoris]QTG74641.1 hypothetical protein J4179_05185 [Trueperella pecoris]
MANETQAACDRLIFALQEFNATAMAARDPQDPSILAAADALADAFTLYDDALYTQYGVETPLDTYDEYEEDYFDDEDVDDEDLEDDDLEDDEDLEDDNDFDFDDLDDEDLDEFDLDD